jgi:hypothetical protein
MTTLVKSFPFYKDINKKIIVHNGDNNTNKFYNMIYLDVILNWSMISQEQNNFLSVFQTNTVLKYW